MRRSRRCGSGCSGCDQPLGLSWSGLPAPGEGRGSRPSIDPRAPALVARWILGTSPRMTTRSQAPQGRSSIVDGGWIACGVETLALEALPVAQMLLGQIRHGERLDGTMAPARRGQDRRRRLAGAGEMAGEPHRVPRQLARQHGKDLPIPAVAIEIALAV